MNQNNDNYKFRIMDKLYKDILKLQVQFVLKGLNGVVKPEHQDITQIVSFLLVAQVMHFLIDN